MGQMDTANVAAIIQPAKIDGARTRSSELHFAMPTPLRCDQYVVQNVWASFANTRTAHLGEKDLLTTKGGSSMLTTNSSSHETALGRDSSITLRDNASLLPFIRC